MNRFFGSIRVIWKSILPPRFHFILGGKSWHFNVVSLSLICFSLHESHMNWLVQPYQKWKLIEIMLTWTRYLYISSKCYMKRSILPACMLNCFSFWWMTTIPWWWWYMCFRYRLWMFCALFFSLPLFLFLLFICLSVYHSCQVCAYVYVCVPFQNNCLYCCAVLRTTNS